MIEACDAHIWWDHRKKLVAIQQIGVRPHPDLLCDGGASYVRWRREYTDADRVREMTEMVIEFLFGGYDPTMVIREFSKVRQFRHLGGRELPDVPGHHRGADGQVS